MNNQSVKTVFKVMQTIFIISRIVVDYGICQQHACNWRAYFNSKFDRIAQFTVHNIQIVNIQYILHTV